MVRKLIVNADDFGAGPNINAGIIKSFERGIVRSVSLVGNGIAFEEAVAYARAHPKLDVGAHLNVFLGTPLTSPRYIVRNDGLFFESIPCFMWNFVCNPKQVSEEITIEFNAQIKRILGAGVSISHLDTDKHLHILPPILKSVLSAAKKYHISAVRFPFEQKSVIKGSIIQRAKIVMSNFLAKRAQVLFEREKISRPDHFFGISFSGRFTRKNLLALFDHLPEGVSELSCHPGYNGDKYGSYINESRGDELETLIDPGLAAYGKKCIIEFTSYNHIFNDATPIV